MSSEKLYFTYMKRILLFVLLLCLFPILLFSQSAKTFLPLASGIEYQFIKGKMKAAKKIAAKGDRIAIQYVFLLNDSMLFDNTQNTQDPKWIPLSQQYEGENALLFAVPYHGLHYMNKGDSVVFRIKVSDFFKNQEIEMPDNFDTNGYFYWRIKAIDYETRDAYIKRLSKNRTINPDFKPVDGALYYKFIQLGNSTKIANVGDLATIHIKYKVADSLIFSSATLEDGEAVPHQIGQPSGVGDLMHGFLLLREGDSAIFRIKAKDLAALYNTTVPTHLKDDDYHVWEVKINTLQTPEEVKQAKEAHEAKQSIIDDHLIVDYLKANGYDDVYRTESGLYYIEIQEGTGPAPAPGQIVTVNYTGQFTNGETFDSNTDPKFNHVEPFQFGIDKNHVVDGMNEGLKMMKKGGKAVIVIPSKLAYGNRGVNDIPPNAILIFELELLDVQDKK